MLSVIDKEQYRGYYDSKIRPLQHTPFQTYSWAECHEDYFDDKFLFLYLEKNNRFSAGLFMFRVLTQYGCHYYTHGRFGTSGLIINPANNPESIVNLLEGFKDYLLHEADVEPLTISIGSLPLAQYSEQEIQDFKTFCTNTDGKYFSRTYHITDLVPLIKIDKKLDYQKFGNSKSRNNLLRNLRIAGDNQLEISEQLSKDRMAAWHAIHVERTQQVNVRPWPLSFFLTILEKDYVNSFIKFFGVYHHGNLVGGATCLFNSHVLDIFMMSTLRQHQKLGANYMLSEHIYNWCADNNIRYVNWQGSVPPEGGTAKFKEHWMAKIHVMHSANLICDKKRFMNLNKEELLQTFPDRFYYPF